MAKQTLAAFARELAKHDLAMARAFLEAVQDIRSSTQRRVVMQAIENNDVSAVVAAFRLGAEYFAPLDRTETQIFEQGAIWQLAQMPKKRAPEGAKLEVRFDHRNPRAERMARQLAGRLITEVSEDQRVLIAATVEEGIAEGRGAQRIARDLLGVQSGNQRVGGLVGLHSRDAEAVRRARAELSEPDAMRDYLRRTKAPGARTVRAAIKRGQPLSAQQIDKITRQYANRLLRVRANRIARTEAHHAFVAGQNEGLAQSVERGDIPASAIKMVWQSTPSVRTRDSHMAMNNQEVRWGEAFISPVTGARMMYPGDTSLGAPASETVNCRCGARPEVNFLALAV